MVKDPTEMEARVARAICGGVCDYPSCDCSWAEKLETGMRARAAIEAMTTPIQVGAMPQKREGEEG